MIDQTCWDQNCLLIRRASFPQYTPFTHQYFRPHPFIFCFFCLSSIYQACDRPPQLSQYQFQPSWEDDGDPGSGRLDHPTQQQGREPPHRHLESKKHGYSWARNGESMEYESVDEAKLDFFLVSWGLARQIAVAWARKWIKNTNE